MSLEPLETEPKPEGVKPAESAMPGPLIIGERLTLMEVWRVLMKQRVTILVVTLLSLGGALWYALRTPPVYDSVSRVEIEPAHTPNVGIEQIVEQGQVGEGATALQTEVRILQSDSILFATAQSLHLIDSLRAAGAAARKKNHQPEPAPGTEISPEERRALITLIRGGLTVSILQNTNLVEIHYRSGNPKQGAAIVNRLVETYADQDMRSKYERTMHVSSWLQTQLEDLKTQATDAQRQLADYQREHNIVGTDATS
jgi:succinoglycan biosynthesis transport protein ExoP